jgi:hypothetical protein
MSARYRCPFPNMAMKLNFTSRKIRNLAFPSHWVSAFWPHGRFCKGMWARRTKFKIAPAKHVSTSSCELDPPSHARPGCATLFPGHDCGLGSSWRLWASRARGHLTRIWAKDSDSLKYGAPRGDPLQSAGYSRLDSSICCSDRAEVLFVDHRNIYIY